MYWHMRTTQFEQTKTFVQFGCIQYFIERNHTMVFSSLTFLFVFLSVTLEPVHIKIASKIMAKEIIARKIISSLS